VLQAGPIAMLCNSTSTARFPEDYTGRRAEPIHVAVLGADANTSGSASIWTRSIGLDRPPVNFVDPAFGSNIREEALLPPSIHRGRKSRKFVGLALAPQALLHHYDELRDK
jgi:hypothetical protein